DRIIRFLEKPRANQVFSYWVNAGIFVIERSVVDEIPTETPIDFGRDVFPKLLDRNASLYAYQMSDGERLWWVDTIEDLKRLQSTITAQMLAGANPPSPLAASLRG